MEQKDYILREIEKIGQMLNMIRKKIVGAEMNNSLPVDFQFEEIKNKMISETGFDIDDFLMLENEESEQYISNYKGFNVANIQFLADIITVLAMKTDPDTKNVYLNKALYLYEHCNSIDKTYSLAREQKIYNLKNILEK
ncbi:MAG: hypothetical protein QNK30_12160 [Bacteroidales bacterium]|nr:hypothetical protein [Bacteroidales bacterium]